MLFSKVQKIAPVGLTALVKAKAVVLRWTKPVDPQHVEILIYRYTSLANATDDVSATLCGRSPTEVFRDDEDLIIGTQYWYRISSLDKYLNESIKSAIVNPVYTGVASTELVGTITDAQTDQTVLGQVTGLALTQAAKDVDEDGKVDIAILATWNALTGAKKYELEITEAGVLIDHKIVSGLKKYIKAKSNKLYSIRIRAISFNGTPGAWLTIPLTITPTKKNVAPTTATGVAVISKPKGNLVSWTKIADADYAETVIYRDVTSVWGTATEVGRTAGNRFRDDAELVIGTLYYYWVRHVDRSGNFGTQNTTAVAVGYRGVDGWNSLVSSQARTLVSTVLNAEEEGWTFGDASGGGDSLVASANFANAIVLRQSHNNSGGNGSVISAFPIDPRKGYQISVGAYCPENIGSRFFRIGFLDKNKAAITLTKQFVYSTRTDGVISQTYIDVLAVAGTLTKRTVVTDLLPSDASLTDFTAGQNALRGAYIPENAAYVRLWFYNVTTISYLNGPGLAVTDWYAPSLAERSVGQMTGSNIINGTIVDAKTDQSSPTGTLAPGVYQTARDVDGDGKVDIAIRVWWSGTLIGAKSYEVEVYDGAEYTYTIVTGFGCIFKAIVGKTYVCKVRGLSFNNTPTGWFTAMDGVNAFIVPTKKANSVATIILTSAIARPKGNVVRWPAPTNKDFSHCNVYRYIGVTSTPGSAELIGKTKSDFFRDDDALTIGDVCWYYVTAVDTSGNEGTKSAGLSTTAAAIVAADTDATALAAPAGTPTLSQLNQDVDADGTVDIAISATWAAVAGSVRYEIEVSTSTTTNGTYTVIDNHIVGTAALIKAFKAKTTLFYRVRVRAFSFNGTAGAWSAVSPSPTTGLKPVKKGAAVPPVTAAIVANGEKFNEISFVSANESDHAFTRVYYSGVNLWDPDHFYLDVPGSQKYLVHPYIFKGSQYYYWLVNFDTSGNQSTRFPNTATSTLTQTGLGYDGSQIQNATVDTLQIAGSAIGTAQIALDAVTAPKIATGAVGSNQIASAAVITSKIAASAVTKRYQAQTAAGIILTTSYAEILAETIDITLDFEWIIFYATFNIASAAAGSIVTMEVRQNTTTLYEFEPIKPINNIGDTVFFMRAFAPASFGSSTNINLRAKYATGACTIQARQLITIMYLR